MNGKQVDSFKLAHKQLIKSYNDLIKNNNIQSTKFINSFRKLDTDGFEVLRESCLLFSQTIQSIESLLPDERDLYQYELTKLFPEQQDRDKFLHLLDIAEELGEVEWEYDGK